MTRQRGLALIVMILLLSLISAFLIASGIEQTSSEVAIESDRRARDALSQAKAALIAYAASRVWSSSYTFPDYRDQPGSLPCPDITNDGKSDTPCSTDASRVGRFPWQTLGAPELRDAGGETLWYALSDNFRTESGTTVVNSDTPGQLTVVGPAAQSDVVAVLIAPGAPVDDPLLAGQSQDRSAANVNRVASYLEDKNASGTTTFTSAAPGANGVYVPAAETYNSLHQGRIFFNDRLLAVTRAELFAVVEPAVASRIERHVKPYLATYFRQWGAFPFPAKFDAPSPGSNSKPAPPATTRTQDQYVGDTSKTSGLLPVTANASYPLSGSGTVLLTGGTADSINSVNCQSIPAGSVDAGFTCTFNIKSLKSWPVCVIKKYCMVNPSFSVSGTVANVFISFADMADSDVKVTSTGGTTRTMSTTALTRTLSSAGAATLSFTGTYSFSRFRDNAFERDMKVTFPVSASALTGSDDGETGFFIRNEWYRQLYYAVSPGYLPGGSGTCVIGSTCLTVRNLPSRYGNAHDKRAILLLTGRSLNGSARPSASVTDYLEGINPTALAAPYFFEHHTGTPTTINDRVVVVCPNSATVTAASDTSPIRITTSAPHDIPDAVGSEVTVSGVAGNTAANGGWTVTVTGSTSFTLDGSTGNGTYTSGGVLCSS